MFMVAVRRLPFAIGEIQLKLQDGPEIPDQKRRQHGISLVLPTFGTIQVVGKEI
jgi:hypothetical protein